MDGAEPLPEWEREFLEKQAAGQAAVPEKCDHAWASEHQPGHALYWVRQCMVCHEVDWDDLDAEIGKLTGHGRLGTMAEITDEMVDRAAAVIFEPPGLYFMTPEAIPYAGMRYREVIRRALAAALHHGDADPSDEDRIRGAMAEARDHPGRTVTR